MNTEPKGLLLLGLALKLTRITFMAAVAELALMLYVTVAQAQDKIVHDA